MHAKCKFTVNCFRFSLLIACLITSSGQDVAPNRPTGQQKQKTLNIRDVERFSKAKQANGTGRRKRPILPRFDLNQL